jgi:hypothetical protein
MGFIFKNNHKNFTSTVANTGKLTKTKSHPFTKSQRRAMIVIGVDAPNVVLCV